MFLAQALLSRLHSSRGRRLACAGKTRNAPNWEPLSPGSRLKIRRFELSFATAPGLSVLSLLLLLNVCAAFGASFSQLAGGSGGGEEGMKFTASATGNAHQPSLPACPVTAVVWHAYAFCGCVCGVGVFVVWQVV